MDIVASRVAGEDHGLERHTVGGGARLDAMGVADGAAAELQNDVIAEQIDELVHLAGVNAARGHRHQLVERSPMLIEENAMLELLRIEVLATDIVVAHG